MYSQAQEELLMVFDEELAFKAYTTFAKFIGADTMERCLKNIDTIRTLCQKYEQNHSVRYVTHYHVTNTTLFLYKYISYQNDYPA